MRGRPLLYTSYEADSALLPSTTKRVAMAVLLVVAFTLPLQLIPGLKWLGSNPWLVVLGTALIYVIGALGLNILTGLAGQVSLGHAFFMGMGAYVAAYLGGETDRGVLGLGLPMWIWLPAAGVAAALVGILVAPTAVRVRGLYLAFVTIALVFIGDHIFRNVRSISGGPGVGRRWPTLELRLWKEETPCWRFPPMVLGSASTSAGRPGSTSSCSYWRSSSPSSTRTSPAQGLAELSPPSAIATSPPR